MPDTEMYQAKKNNFFRRKKMNTTKTPAKLFLIISLFASVALADDGQMSGGNKTGGSPESGIPLCEEGQMSSGNFVCEERSGNSADSGNAENNDESNTPDSILTIVQDYLASLFG